MLCCGLWVLFTVPYGTTGRNMIHINNKLVQVFKFPAGEVNPVLPQGIKPPFRVVLRFTSSDDLIAVMLIQDALLRHFNVGIKELVVPYLPYGRQDRVCNNGEALSRDVIVGLLGSLRANVYKTLDVHSDGMPPGWELKETTKLSFLGINSVVCCPDEGAKSRVAKWAGAHKVIQGVKTRDPATGKLSGFGIIASPEDVEGRDVWILDDICDGGGTFLGLFQYIEALNPRSINLYTTHGLYTKGLEVLCAAFDKVVTTDSCIYEGTRPDNFEVMEVVNGL